MALEAGATNTCICSDRPQISKSYHEHCLPVFVQGLWFWVAIHNDHEVTMGGQHHVRWRAAERCFTDNSSQGFCRS
eukprot:10246531-Karenia_brevis.AAC.1